MTLAEPLARALHDTSPQPGDVHHFAVDWRSEDEKATHILAALRADPAVLVAMAEALHWFHCDAGTPATHAPRHDREAAAILDRLLGTPGES